MAKKSLGPKRVRGCDTKGCRGKCKGDYRFCITCVNRIIVSVDYKDFYLQELPNERPNTRGEER